MNRHTVAPRDTGQGFCDLQELEVAMKFETWFMISMVTCSGESLDTIFAVVSKIRRCINH